MYAYVLITAIVAALVIGLVWLVLKYFSETQQKAIHEAAQNAIEQTRLLVDAIKETTKAVAKEVYGERAEIPQPTMPVNPIEETQAWWQSDEIAEDPTDWAMPDPPALDFVPQERTIGIGPNEIPNFDWTETG